MLSLKSLHRHNIRQPLSNVLVQTNNHERIVLESGTERECESQVPKLWLRIIHNFYIYSSSITSRCIVPKYQKFDLWFSLQTTPASWYLFLPTDNIPSTDKPRKFLYFSVKCDTWHMTNKMWHVTHNTHWMVNIGSKCQVTSSKFLEFMMSCYMLHLTCDMWQVECDT